jgi:1,4-alpha-glucan branching enzyme
VGETNPFLYFVSHQDIKLAEAVRRGRKREFAARCGEPATDAATFASSKIDWEKPGYRRMRACWPSSGNSSACGPSSQPCMAGSAG